MSSREGTGRAGRGCSPAALGPPLATATISPVPPAARRGRRVSSPGQRRLRGPLHPASRVTRSGVPGFGASSNSVASGPAGSLPPGGAARTLIPGVPARRSSYPACSPLTPVMSSPARGPWSPRPSPPSRGRRCRAAPARTWGGRQRPLGLAEHRAGDRSQLAADGVVRLLPQGDDLDERGPRGPHPSHRRRRRRRRSGRWRARGVGPVAGAARLEADDHRRALTSTSSFAPMIWARGAASRSACRTCPASNWGWITSGVQSGSHVPELAIGSVVSYPTARPPGSVQPTSSFAEVLGVLGR